jgi:hypothetical protein
MYRASRSYILGLATSVVACAGSSAAKQSAAPRPVGRPLAALASTGAIVVPAFTIVASSEFGWVSRIGDSRLLLRDLDSSIVEDLRARGLGQGWVFAPALVASYKRNPGYATDPYSLAEQPLLSEAFVAGTRLPEPLASQLRTMIALHENARLVLLPVNLLFVPVPGAPNDASARLKVAVVDPRLSEAVWVGEVRSDTASSDPRVLAKAVASHLVDLVAAR